MSADRPIVAVPSCSNAVAGVPATAAYGRAVDGLVAADGGVGEHEPRPGRHHRIVPPQEPDVVGGQKFGIYLVPGIPKAAVDANLPIYGTPYHAADIADLQQWRAALDRTHRPIHLELSNPTNWASRTVKRWTDAPKWVPFAGPGHWNDMDSVEIGNGDVDGLTPDERVRVMTLQAAPLLLGTDLTKLDPFDLSLITNREVIAVDQSGRPGHPVNQATPQQVWFSDDEAGTYTVALFNLAGTPATVTAGRSDLGISPDRRAAVRDLWSHTDLGVVAHDFSATVPAHGARLLRVRVPCR